MLRPHQPGEVQRPEERVQEEEEPPDPPMMGDKNMPSQDTSQLRHNAAIAYSPNKISVQVFRYHDHDLKTVSSTLQKSSSYVFVISYVYSSPVVVTVHTVSIMVVNKEFLGKGVAEFSSSSSGSDSASIPSILEKVPWCSSPSIPRTLM